MRISCWYNRSSRCSWSWRCYRCYWIWSVCSNQFLSWISRLLIHWARSFLPSSSSRTVPATPTSTLPLAHAHERMGKAKWLTPVSLLNVSLRTELLDEAALAWRPLESILTYTTIIIITTTCLVVLEVRTRGRFLGSKYWRREWSFKNRNIGPMPLGCWTEFFK